MVNSPDVLDLWIRVPYEASPRMTDESGRPASPQRRRGIPDTATVVSSNEGDVQDGAKETLDVA